MKSWCHTKTATENLSCTSNKSKSGKHGFVLSGDDSLRFGDVLTAVASLFLITVLVSYPLETVLIPTLGFYLEPKLGALVSVLTSSLIVDYISRSEPHSFIVNIWVVCYWRLVRRFPNVHERNYSGSVEFQRIICWFEA